MRMLIDCVSDFDAAGWRWPHFVPRELACHCGGGFCRGEYWHDPDFLDALEVMGAGIGKPLVINSGHRCELWNAHVGGAAHSMYRTITVDIRLAGQDPFALLKQAEVMGFTGFGLGRNFLHFERRAGADPAHADRAASGDHVCRILRRHALVVRRPWLAPLGALTGAPGPVHPPGKSAEEQAHGREHPGH